jgi:hypothetical protein
MSSILQLLGMFRINPIILCGYYPEMVKFLHRQGILTLEKGYGNPPTDQEACFAVEAEKAGYKFLEKNAQIPTEGMFYKYQLNGSQNHIDFMLIENNYSVKIELKSSKGMSFYWNDGWFETDVIYLVSFKEKKIDKVYIGYGEDTFEKEDNDAWILIRETIKKLNKEVKKTKYLKIYNRLANQYSCKQFTSEFCETKFQSLKIKLSLQLA